MRQIGHRRGLSDPACCAPAWATTTVELRRWPLGSDLIGQPQTYEDVARGLEIPRRGLSLQDLARIAADRAVSTNGYRFSNLELANSAVGGKPWLALLGSGVKRPLRRGSQVIADTVLVLDPARGMRKIKRRWFEKLWTGYALLIE